GPLILDAQGKVIEAKTNSRWVGKGRTVYNNKGKPVKQYEPFFSSTVMYEPEADLTDAGVTPILFYDPVGRLIITLRPNHSYEKVLFDAWRQITWDANDTVKLNARQDPETAAQLARLPKPDYPSTWYDDHTGAAASDADKDAASKVAAHAGTPS